jgi:hypothetical protein
VRRPVRGETRSSAQKELGRTGDDFDVEWSTGNDTRWDLTTEVAAKATFLTVRHEDMGQTVISRWMGCFAAAGTFGMCASGGILIWRVQREKKGLWAAHNVTTDANPMGFGVLKP